MNVITISREYGAGGHTIGQKVAERLGIEFYDRDIILNTVKESGLDFEQILKHEESISKTDVFLRAIVPAAFDIKDTIFEYERRIIIELASKGPCVILGRCASAILEEEGIESTKVFLFADEEHRAPRVSQLIGSDDPSEIRRAMRKIDGARHGYFECYIGRDWGVVHEYDMSLDTGTLGYDTCVDLICAAAK